MCVCVYECVWGCVYVCVCVGVHLCPSTVCLYVPICMFVCKVCVCVGVSSACEFREECRPFLYQAQRQVTLKVFLSKGLSVCVFVCLCVCVHTSWEQNCQRGGRGHQKKWPILSLGI